MKSLMLLVEMSKNHRIIVRCWQSPTKQLTKVRCLAEVRNDLTQEQQLKLEATSFTALGADALLERRV